jgi:succinate-semialdehyde dehydrogenase/glutarate-semialdehyde dehydrogenase
MPILSVNPATGETLARHDEMDAGELDAIATAAAAAQPAWAARSFSERGATLREAARILRAESERFSRLMTDEMGKPLAQAQAEVEKCAWVCDYYSDHGERFLARLPVETDASRSFVCFEPLGVVLAVMPWNFPFWQVFRFAAPALMAGNGGLLKHASNVFGSALAIEEVLHRAGVPAELFRTLRIGGSRVASLLEHPGIAAATLTGSGPAGRAVAAKAGEQLKKTVLELGGSDPYLVLEDADLEAAAESCVTSRLINGGQSCIAAKRFIVLDEVYDTFERLFVERMAARRCGDPYDPTSDLGPLARTDLRDELHGQVEASVAGGARLALGGEVPDGPGAYYPPTVLAEVAPGQAAWDEELFGPVAALIRVEDEAAAVRVANGSSFGLGAAVFTGDLARGEEIAAHRLQAGACFVNSFVKSDPRLPFGGIKQSGYGRELSHFGMQEFVNVKSVYIA